MDLLIQIWKQIKNLNFFKGYRKCKSTKQKVCYVVARILIALVKIVFRLLITHIANIIIDYMANSSFYEKSSYGRSFKKLQFI